MNQRHSGISRKIVQCPLGITICPQPGSLLVSVSIAGVGHVFVFEQVITPLTSYNYNPFRLFFSKRYNTKQKAADEPDQRAQQANPGQFA